MIDFNDMVVSKIKISSDKEGKTSSYIYNVAEPDIAATNNSKVSSSSSS